jgi:hypothetical protein
MVTKDNRPPCNFCQSNPVDLDEYACWDCMEKLKGLMKGITVENVDSGTYDPSIEIKNVKLTTDYPGEAVVAIDGTGAAGVQKPFKFDGQGKCIVCDELTTDSIVCKPCKGAIRLARRIMNDDAGEFLNLFQDEGFIALLKFVSSNAVRKYMEAEIEHIRKD